MAKLHMTVYGQQCSSSSSFFPEYHPSLLGELSITGELSTPTWVMASSTTLDGDGHSAHQPTVAPSTMTFLNLPFVTPTDGHNPTGVTCRTLQ